MDAVPDFAIFEAYKFGTRIAKLLAVLEPLACSCCASQNVVALWVKCEDCGEVSAQEHAKAHARQKRDPRREPRARSGDASGPAARIGGRPNLRLVSVASAPRSGATLLDVTLRRGGEVRRWTITSELDGWSCRVVRPNSVTVCRCGDGDAVVAMERQWSAEIEAARADGWS